MLDTLRALAGSDRPWARERAEAALLIRQEYELGRLSDSEYQELLLDLTRLDQVELAAEDIEFKTALVTAIWAIAQVR